MRWRTPAVRILFTGALLSVAACGGDARSEGAPEDAAPPVDAPAVEASTGEDTAPPSEPVAPPATAAATPSATPPEAPGAAGAPGRQEPAPRPAPAGPVEPQRTEVNPPPPLVPQPAPDLAPAEPVPAIPVGTEIAGELVTALATETSRPGDRFSATVQEDILAANGMVLVPRGSEIRGQVTEARESGGSDDPAVLRLAVDALVLEGREVPVSATVIEAEVRTEARDSGTRTAAKVATGAAAGALVGRILGRDSRSTAAGAAAGAAAGTAVALATRDGHAVLEPGSRIVIRLDRPVWEF